MVRVTYRYVITAIITRDAIIFATRRTFSGLFENTFVSSIDQDGPIKRHRFSIFIIHNNLIIHIQMSIEGSRFW